MPSMSYLRSLASNWLTYWNSFGVGRIASDLINWSWWNRTWWLKSQILLVLFHSLLQWRFSPAGQWRWRRSVAVVPAIYVAGWEMSMEEEERGGKSYLPKTNKLKKKIRLSYHVPPHQRVLKCVPYMSLQHYC